MNRLLRGFQVKDARYYLRAFTLVELVVLMVIMVLLVALLFPAGDEQCRRLDG
jgi:type II secretory pathway pseudopilin PulG